MEFSIKFYTYKSIVYIEGSQVILSKKIIIFLSLKIDYVLANSADPDEMPHYSAFHQGLDCCQSTCLCGFLVFKELRQPKFLFMLLC